MRLLEESERKEIAEISRKKNEEMRMKQFARTFVAKLNMKDILNRLVAIDDHKLNLGSYGVDVSLLFNQ